MTGLQESTHAVREFNRFYTRTIGLLNETLTESDFTLTEARVLFELGHRSAVGATEIASDLLLDPAYLARILRRFREAGLIDVRADGDDRRRRILELTAVGRDALAGLQARSEVQISGMMAALLPVERENLLDAMARIRETLEKPPAAQPTVALRAHRPGDIGWVIGRQSSLYAREYGWTIEYDALVTRICADFLRDFREGQEFCWIAERAGERLGAVFLVRQDEEVAKLRMLHVERAARGQGIGAMLVGRCVEQARTCGYRRLTLWTNSVLVDARRLYERAGFTLVSEEAHHSFGHDLVGQYWALEL
jgi:DNA-binding MarR family transcriptional regulator/N-acetylglutamate synthase-like GNAT family acetyltransferase